MIGRMARFAMLAMVLLSACTSERASLSIVRTGSAPLSSIEVAQETAEAGLP